MARLPRFSSPGYPRHVIQRGNNRLRLFAGTADYLMLRDCLLAAVERYSCQIHAYVFMTNHVHLLISESDKGAISKVMQSVGGRYARYFNDRYGRTGSLWEGRYRATVVSTDQYLFTCFRYIEENPVRAGMVIEPAEYRWSSYGANALGTGDPLVTPHERYTALGASPREREAAYRSLFLEALSPMTLAEIRDATNFGWALGNERFKQNLVSDRRAGRVRAPRLRCLTPKG